MTSVAGWPSWPAARPCKQKGGRRNAAPGSETFSRSENVTEHKLHHAWIRQRGAEVSKAAAGGELVIAAQLHRPHVEARGIRNVEHRPTELHKLVFADCPAFCYCRVDIKSAGAAQAISQSSLTWVGGTEHTDSRVRVTVAQDSGVLEYVR